MRWRIMGVLDADDLVRPDQILQLGYPPNRIDLLTSITGVEFDAAWNNRSSGEIGGVPIFVIGRTELLANKRATGRPQDLVDIQSLETE
jgi:hypothetical protein